MSVEEKKKPVVSVTVSAKFSRLGSEVETLRAAIARCLVPAIGESSQVNASINLNDSDGLLSEQTAYGSIAEWLAALGRPGENCNLYASGNKGVLSLSIRSSDLNVSLQGEPAKSAEFRDCMMEFSAAAGLKAAPVARLAEQPVTFRKTGTYRLLSPIAEESFQSLMEVLGKWTGEAGTFTGTVVRKSNPDITEEVRSPQRWQALMSGELADILSARYSSFRVECNVSLDFQQIAGTVALNAAAPDPESVQAIFADLERILNVTLLQASASKEGLKRERRQYYMQSPITREWLQGCLDLLEKYSADPRSFNGTVRIEGQDLSFQDLNSWKREIESRWNDVQTITYSRGIYQDSQYVTIDFERQQVSLTLQVRLDSGGPDSGGQRGLTFQDFELELKLDPVKGRPYQYYRFARKYQKQNEWTRGDDIKFADAISRSVATAFPGERFAVVNASFTFGDKAQEQVPCATMKEFLDALRSGTEYSVGQITIQGPRGWDLMIRVERATRNIVIRSSIAKAGVFKDAIEGFTNIQDLDLLSADDRPPQDAPAAKESKTSFWVPLLVPVLSGVVAFVVALFTSSSGLSSHKSTLTITVPTKSANGEVQVSGSQVPVRWVVVSNALSHGDQPEEVPATITVEKEASLIKREYKTQRPGAQIDFPTPGIYYVTVRPETGSAPEQSIRVIVAASPKT